MLRPGSLPTQPPSVHTGAVDWIGIGVILTLGIAVVAYGYLWDRTNNRQRQRAAESAPDRDVPGLAPDAAVPAYVTAKDLSKTRKTMDAGELAEIQSRIAATTPIRHGHGPGAFATDTNSGLAVLHHPLVLIAEGELTSVRELLPVFEQARKSAKPLVIAATRISDEVYQTLEANTLVGSLACVAVPIADPTAATELAELTGATALEVSDLKMGWVPAESLGTCEIWVSKPDRLWILNSPKP